VDYLTQFLDKMQKSAKILLYKTLKLLKSCSSYDTDIIRGSFQPASVTWSVNGDWRVFKRLLIGRWALRLHRPAGRSHSLAVAKAAAAMITAGRLLVGLARLVYGYCAQSWEGYS